MEQETNQKPLTLNDLAKYNQEVLIPAMEEVFVTKKEFSGLDNKVDALDNKVDALDNKVDALESKLNNLESEFQNFKNESLTNQDAILKKLDTLMTEKTVREYQEQKEKKLWAVVLKALKEHDILSQKDMQRIAQLEIF